MAYDDDVIFLGTGTFTMLLEISKNNASAVQNQCLLDSLLKNVANSYSMKRLGHEHGRTKDKPINQKKETEISMTSNFWKKICHGLHTVAPVALAALVALFGSIFA